MYKKALTVLGFLALGAVPSFGDVAPPAFTFTGGNYAAHGFEQTVGYKFQVNGDALDVGSLQWYAPSAGTDSSPHEVGIWDVATHQLVTQACVGNPCADSSYDVSSDYWVTAISSVQLARDTQYIIGGYINETDGIIDTASSISGGSLLTYEGELYSQPYGPTLTEPLNSYDPQAAGYVGPNLSVSVHLQTQLAATPEPTFYGFLGAGLAAMAFAVRRRRSV